MDAIADEPVKTPGKKATAKARAKVAQEADVKSSTNVTRIVAKDSPRKKK